MSDLATLKYALKTISNDLGLLHHVIKLPGMNLDPKMVSYGILPANTEFLSGEKFSGRSSGCGFSWESAMLGTIGESLERYAPSFHNPDEGICCAYTALENEAIHPKEYALFHAEQFKDKRFQIVKFTENTELTWFPMHDLTDGIPKQVPGQFIYMPFSKDNQCVTFNTSTGLAAHSNYYKAIITALYEVIERDSFTITWMQDIVPEKINISKEIQIYLNRHFPLQYEWHFFNATYDIKVPSVFGIRFGEAEYGKFVAVGSSTRGTFVEALRKVIQEIGQAVPYFRYLLGEKKEWNPSDDFNLIQNFEDHSIFYTKRQDLWHVFEKWRDQPGSFDVDWQEQLIRSDTEEIRHVVKILKDLDLNVLIKDLTTPDIRESGFYSIKAFVPQLIPLAGSYPFYFLGGKRLYEVPKKMGFNTKDYFNLNKYPHPFP